MDIVEYEDQLIKAFERVDGIEIIKAVNLIHDTWMARNYIYIIGNGGSAYTASHFALDLYKTADKVPPIHAISLCNDPGLMLAISNDIGDDRVFIYQLIHRMMRDDLLISFSTSGNSENIIEAVNFAKINHLHTLSFTGFDGGYIKELSEYNVWIPCNDVMMTENIFSILCHYITSKLKNNESIYGTEQLRLF